MVKISKRLISPSRQLLQNPYAHLDGDGEYDCVGIDIDVSVHTARRLLENQYAYLNAEGSYDTPPANNAEQARTDFIALPHLRGSRDAKSKYSKRQINNIALKLLRELWRRRDNLLDAQDDITPANIADPYLALKTLGFAVKEKDGIGNYTTPNGDTFEVAGLLDHDNKQVDVSMRFSPKIRRFTAAHELAHIVLHQQTGLHRDRATDGNSSSTPRNTTETEADNFAAFFLMPEKQVMEAFKRRFLAHTFKISNDTAYALNHETEEAMKNRCRTLRDLARILAQATFFNGKHFSSIADQFQVSIETMAIRIEELGLAKL